MAKIILFQGDSITDCNRVRTDITSMGTGYANMVKGNLGCERPGEFEFINKAASGSNVVDVYSRVRSEIINLKPDYMSLLIGVNDVWHELAGRCNGVAADKYEKIYDMMISEIKAALPDIKIMIMEPFVLEGSATKATEAEPGRWDYFRTEVPMRAAAAKRIAEKYNLKYLPLQYKFDECCKIAPAEYWLMDGVHPTTMGHWVLMNEWMKCFSNEILN
jgi:lysophospholipase L1-like esterase